MRNTTIEMKPNHQDVESTAPDENDTSNNDMQNQIIFECEGEGIHSLFPNRKSSSNLKRCASKNTVNTVDSSRSSLSVQFESVEIREYDMILGDNPSSQYGPPVTIDWDYEVTSSKTLDEYEETRKPRRTPRQLVMNERRRRHVLTDLAGYTQDELVRAEKDGKKIRQQRERTKMMLPFAKVEEFTQSAGRKISRRRSSTSLKL